MTMEILTELQNRRNLRKIGGEPTNGSPALAEGYAHFTWSGPESIFLKSEGKRHSKRTVILETFRGNSTVCDVQGVRTEAKECAKINGESVPWSGRRKNVEIQEE